MVRSVLSEIDQFAEDLRQEIISEAHLEGAESLRPEAFMARMIQELTEAGELDDGQVAFFQARGMEVSGYSVADEGVRLDLLVAIYTQVVPSETVTKSQVETGFTRMLTFFDRARADLATSLEESTAAFDLAVTIRELKDLEKLRLFVVTDGRTTLTARPPESRNGR